MGWFREATLAAKFETMTAKMCPSTSQRLKCDETVLPRLVLVAWKKGNNKNNLLICTVQFFAPELVVMQMGKMKTVQAQYGL